MVEERKFTAQQTSLWHDSRGKAHCLNSTLPVRHLGWSPLCYFYVLASKVRTTSPALSESIQIYSFTHSGRVILIIPLKRNRAELKQCNPAVKPSGTPHFHVFQVLVSLLCCAASKKYPDPRQRNENEKLASVHGCGRVYRSYDTRADMCSLHCKVFGTFLNEIRVPRHMP